MRLSHLVAAVLLGTLLYLFTFSFVVEKSITSAEIGTYLDYKTHYLASISNQKKIVVFAGSNGRYSHRCQTIQQTTGIACANVSIAAGMSMLWQFKKYAAYLHSGDVLYMPLEYWPPFPPDSRVGLEAPYVVRYDHAALSMYWPSQMGDALFYFDIRYLCSALGEMMLKSVGVTQRRTSIHTMTAQGDESGHDATKSVQYREFIDRVKVTTIDPAAYSEKSLVTDLASVIAMAEQRHVVVVGGLPTTFEDLHVSDEVLYRIRNLFESRGACFLELANRSQFPRNGFFDSPYHLQEEMQIAYSASISPILGEISKLGCCLPAHRR